jgi:MFS family permease
LRPKLRRVFIGAAALASITYVTPYFADTFTQLIALVAMASLFQGGIAGLLNGMIAVRTPPGQHGAAFGASQVAHSMGVALGPLLGGVAVVTFGLRSVFLVNVGVFAAILVVAILLLRTGAMQASPSTSTASEPPPD